MCKFWYYTVCACVFIHVYVCGTVYTMLYNKKVMMIDNNENIVKCNVFQINSSFSSSWFCVFVLFLRSFVTYFFIYLFKEIDLCIKTFCFVLCCKMSKFGYVFVIIFMCRFLFLFIYITKVSNMPSQRHNKMQWEWPNDV